jgi:hypothetical protein
MKKWEITVGDDEFGLLKALVDNALWPWESSLESARQEEFPQLAIDFMDRQYQLRRNLSNALHNAKFFGDVD